MTPKEKAKDLVETYMSKILTQHSAWNVTTENSFPMPLKFSQQIAKECAHIAVDEILNDYAIFNEKHKSYKVPSFWQEVKQSIDII